MEERMRAVPGIGNAICALPVLFSCESLPVLASMTSVNPVRDQ
jgi:hypothetical protein